MHIWNICNLQISIFKGNVSLLSTHNKISQHSRRSSVTTTLLDMHETIFIAFSLSYWTILYWLLDINSRRGLLLTWEFFIFRPWGYITTCTNIVVKFSVVDSNKFCINIIFVVNVKDNGRNAFYISSMYR